MKIVTFLRKNNYHPKRVLDFPLERDTFRNKIMEIVEDFDEKSYNNNGEPWKSSRILRVKTKTLKNLRNCAFVFHGLFIFAHCYSLFLIVFHVFLFSFFSSFSFHFSIFFHLCFFSVVRADAKTRQNRREVPIVKRTIFFCENRIWGIGGKGQEWPI